MARPRTGVLVLSSVVTCLFPSVPSHVEAQMREVTEAVLVGFHTVAGHVEAATEAVPTEHLRFRPAEDVRTFGEIVDHLVDSHRYYCALARVGNANWADPVERAAPGKEELLALLRESVRECTEVAEKEGTQIAPLIENLGHTNLHYGNLVTYMRLKGMTPPSSGGG